MNEDIRNRLIEVSLPDSKDFQAKIVNSKYPVLGSRMAQMREIARELKEIDLTKQAKDKYYEEILIRGLILAYAKGSILDKFDLIEDYLGNIDTWALTDSFCSTFIVKQEEREKLKEKLISYLNTDNEFLQRFALIMFLSHFIRYNREGNKLKRPKELSLKDLIKTQDNSYIKEILSIINRPYYNYYDSMGAAWLIAEMFLYSPKTVLVFLTRKNKLDTLTFNRTIDKIRQSRQPDKEVKELIKELKKDTKST